MKWHPLSIRLVEWEMRQGDNISKLLFSLSRKLAKNGNFACKTRSAQNVTQCPLFMCIFCFYFTNLKQAVQWGFGTGFFFFWLVSVFLFLYDVVVVLAFCLQRQFKKKKKLYWIDSSLENLGVEDLISVCGIAWLRRWSFPCRAEWGGSKVFFMPVGSYSKYLNTCKTYLWTLQVLNTLKVTKMFFFCLRVFFYCCCK